MGKTRGRHTKRKVGGRRTRRGGYWFYPSDNDDKSSWSSLNPFKKKDEGAAPVVPASSESEPAPEPAVEESSAPAPGGPAEGPAEPSVQEEPSMAGGRRRRRRKSRKASRRKSRKGKKARKSRKSRKSKRRSRKRAYKKRK